MDILPIFYKVIIKDYNNGDCDAWEQHEFGSAFTNLQNNTLSRAELSNESGIAKNVHYGDVLIKYGSILDIKKEELPWIVDSSKVSKMKTSYLQNGDIVIADTAEDETVGKCCEVKGIDNQIVVSGLHTMAFRPTFKFAPMYLGYYLNSDSFHRQLFTLMQGIKVTSISKTAIKTTAIAFPKSLEEQEEIGKLFASLDSLLTLHQRKQ